MISQKNKLFKRFIIFIYFISYYFFVDNSKNQVLINEEGYLINYLFRNVFKFKRKTCEFK